MNTELDTFIYKFKHLWKVGLDAHLDIECCAGQAWVGLRVRLGQEPGHLHHHHFISPQPKRTRDGPARQRRREKRAAERNVTADKASATADKANDEDVVFEATGKVDKITTSSNNNESAEKALVDTKEVTEEETLVPTKIENAVEATKPKEVKLVEPTDEIDNETMSKSEVPPRKLTATASAPFISIESTWRN